MPACTLRHQTTPLTLVVCFALAVSALSQAALPYTTNWLPTTELLKPLQPSSLPTNRAAANHTVPWPSAASDTTSSLVIKHRDLPSHRRWAHKWHVCLVQAGAAADAPFGLELTDRLNKGPAFSWQETAQYLNMAYALNHSYDYIRIRWPQNMVLDRNPAWLPVAAMRAVASYNSYGSYDFILYLDPATVVRRRAPPITQLVDKHRLDQAVLMLLPEALAPAEGPQEGHPKKAGPGMVLFRSNKQGIALLDAWWAAPIRMPQLSKFLQQPGYELGAFQAAILGNASWQGAVALDSNIVQQGNVGGSLGFARYHGEDQGMMSREKDADFTAQAALAFYEHVGALVDRGDARSRRKGNSRHHRQEPQQGSHNR